MIELLKNLWLLVMEIFKTIFKINTTLGNSLLKVIGIGSVSIVTIILVIPKFIWPKIKRWIDEG